MIHISYFLQIPEMFVWFQSSKSIAYQSNDILFVRSLITNRRVLIRIYIQYQRAIKNMRERCRLRVLRRRYRNDDTPILLF